MNWIRLIYFVLSPTLMFVSLWLGWIANQSIRNSMLVDRISVSWIGGLLKGPANVHGTARVHEQTLTGPLSNEPCLYYRKLVERETTDSDGDKTWVTVESTTQSVSFRFEDRTGLIIVEPSSAVLRANRSYFRQSGNMRYSEWNITAGSELFLLGWYTGNRFRKTKQVPFVISEFDEAEYQKGQSIDANFAFFFAIVAGTFSIFFGAIALRIHQVPLFLTSLCLFIPIWLITQWALLIHHETKFSTEQLRQAGSEIESLPIESNQQALAKLSHNDSVVRYRKFARRFPNRFVSWVSFDNRIEPYELTPEERTFVSDFPLPERDAPMGSLVWGMTLGVVASAGGFVSTYFAFKKLKLKRLIENVPTSPAAGVVVGALELNGTARPKKQWLISKYSKYESVWYAYETLERRKSGKSSRWVVIDSGTNSAPFYLQDETGEVLVDPKDAKIDGHLVFYKKRGRRMKREWAIGSEERLYLLGQAVHQDIDDSNLTIGKGEPHNPFIISVRKERDIMIGYSSIGFLLATIAANCGSIATLSLLSIAGFSPFHFFTSGLLPLACLAGIVVLFIYNDLVFVRQRVSRANSMLDIAIRKRADLIPQLQKIVNEFCAHEKRLQTQLADLRAKEWHSISDREEVDSISTHSANQLFGLMESTPDLHGHKQALSLQKGITELENEISFCRAGYNDAVQQYNSRIGSIPDLFLARLAGLKKKTYFRPD